jgi:curved DNA-binding protein
MKYKDYYQVLGVQRTATDDELKRAYRNLARQFHPDVAPNNPEAEARFKEVAEAYEVLSNPEHRQLYDQLGDNWHVFRDGGAPTQQESFWRNIRRNFDQSRTQQGSGTEGFGGFSDFFRTFFGGTRTDGGPEGSDGNPLRRTLDVEATAAISLEDAYTGGLKGFNVEGEVVKLYLKPGIRAGQRLKVKGKGRKMPLVTEPGDLFLTLDIAPHPRFRRDGDDLHLEIEVDVLAALLGYEITLRHLDGKLLKVPLPDGLQNGQTLRLRGKGMPLLSDPDKHGALYVKVSVALPKDLTPAERKHLNQLAKHRPPRLEY